MPTSDKRYIDDSNASTRQLIVEIIKRDHLMNRVFHVAPIIKQSYGAELREVCVV